MKKKLNETKILIVPKNGQVSLGKELAGKQVLIEYGDKKITITEGEFIKKAYEKYYTEKAWKIIDEFEEWSKTKQLF